jgi:putative two-component system response regulator
VKLISCGAIVTVQSLHLAPAIACLSRAEALHDLSTNSHCHRVSAIIKRVTLQLGLTPAESLQVAEAALVHDIGKLAVPMEILQKSTALSREEFALIKIHSPSGYDILSAGRGPLMTMAATIALNHHERYDGSGYPAGLSGETIPLAARVTAICDVYDALRQDRPYRRGLSHDDVMKIIVEGDGRTMPGHFDPRILAAFRAVSDYAKDLLDAA